MSRARLSSWRCEYRRLTKPFHCGRAAKGMHDILVFDRASTPAEEMRFSLLKLDRFPRQAWDFQDVIHPAEQDREYGYRARAVWKKCISPEDGLAEYPEWARSVAGHLPTGRIESPAASAASPGQE